MNMTPHDLIYYYTQGYFPMAEHREDTGFELLAPHTRALLPIENFHVPRRLKRRLNQAPYRITFDKSFSDVIHACADAARGHEDNTWINNDIILLFLQLHELGYAHSVECWDKDETLVGGLYGVAIGSTFCGESMFSSKTDASKIALVHLVEHLKNKNFKLLDSQFRNPHLDQFGLYEIPQDEYVRQMQAGLDDNICF